jgi:hypothetical protein
VPTKNKYRAYKAKKASRGAACLFINPLPFGKGAIDLLPSPKNGYLKPN